MGFSEAITLMQQLTEGMGIRAGRSALELGQPQASDPRKNPGQDLRLDEAEALGGRGGGTKKRGVRSREHRLPKPEEGKETAGFGQWQSCGRGPRSWVQSHKLLLKGWPGLGVSFL